jgi:hypothetical protein
MKCLYILSLVCIYAFSGMAQQLKPVNEGSSKDTLASINRQIEIFAPPPKHSASKAAIRSAILPGWGQAYNHKYWKIPIVYTALGITAGIFNYNLKQYKKIQYAYGVLVTQDVANYGNVAVELQPFISQNAQSALSNLRSDFRQNIDYSVLFFILFWGLNVIDATVDAHLKGFDVTDQIGFYIKPSVQAFSNTAGISFVFPIGKQIKNYPSPINH